MTEEGADMPPDLGARSGEVRVVVRRRAPAASGRTGGVEPFNVADAETAAALSAEGGRLGLSLGDRACLALASAACSGADR
jgi:PIN domain nuclease of toxin-antitoxin system